jgi:LytS/YehU family sensor histidine kinase
MVVEMENSQLKMKNLEAINNQLKQQIHPHFLFNSLSTLKTLISQSSIEAESYLIRLSDFLRSSIAAKAANMVKIGDEVQSCTDYLEMQKIRFGEALQFSINIPPDISDKYYLPVFSLQVLVENAIKHNTLTKEMPLFIDVNFISGMITITNNLQPKKIYEPSAGTGLGNLTERFKLLSGEGIIINSTDKTFSVSLKPLNHENNYNRG